MKFVLGKKLEMSQRFREDGTVIPVTLVKVEPCFVTRIKSAKADGYGAVLIGGGISAKKVSRPKAGQLKDLPTLKHLREFRISEDEATKFKKGDKIDVSIFAPGEKVDIIGFSKGKGFAGVVKRHHFHGGPASHGHKDQLRMPGSIGSKRQGPVEKGKKMAGRMGGERVTVKNLEIVEVNAENDLMAVKGAVPGARNGLLLIKG